MFQEDNLSILLIDEQTKIVVQTVNVGGGGGGGTRTIYKDKNVTEYRTITEYVHDEVQGATTEVEKIVEKRSAWSLFWAACFFLLIIGLTVKLAFLSNTSERRYENNEKTNNNASNDYPRT